MRFWAQLFFLLLIPLLGGEIEIVYHIATMKNWADIASEQLSALEESGLGEACSRITVIVVGSHIRRVHKLCNEFPFRGKMEIVHAGNDLHLYEFPAIERASKIANERSDAKILYMHTKGVSHYRRPSQKNVELWRRYLEYFVIHQWRACVEALNTADLCGVDWKGEPELHFSGNFWWTRADYLRTCHGTAKRHGRWDCEYFIGSGIEPRVKTLHQSGQDLYRFSYHPSYYRK